MVAPGGALNAERTWQTPSVDEGNAQQVLDLGIAAAQLVLSPPGDCVVDCRIEPDQKASTLRWTLVRRSH
jgi:hypothetical protein